MFTNTDRMAALQNASPQVAELYGSETLTKFISNYRRQFGIENDLFVDLVGDTVLGLIPSEKFVTVLIENFRLEEEAARYIMEKLGSLSVTTQIVTSSKDMVKTEAVRPTLANPLTRDELMKALETKRALSGNIETMRKKLEEAAQPKVGYEDQNDQ